LKDDNVKGATTAFCTFTPFKSRCARALHWVVLKGAPVNTEKIRLRRFLHYMAFAAVSPRQLKRAQIPLHPRLRSGAMLFISAFNGNAEPYIRGFSENLAGQMNDLWRGCVDWLGAEEYDNLEKFIEQYRRRADFHFNAYPDASVNLLTALRLRAELDELVALAHRDPKGFLDGYRRAAQVAWGRPA